MTGDLKQIVLQRAQKIMEELGIVETAKVQEETPTTKPALPTTYDELDSDDLYVR